jgi:hypothetical protein
MTAFWDIAPWSPVEVDWRFKGANCRHHQGLIMAAVHASETSVYFNETTWRYIPEGCQFHSRRRENLKSRLIDLANRYSSG